ncbi:LOW QUALITY PROTEIN: protein NRT1/ PTR FAMILY 3.1-like [Phalaenopsis equestris]|uniref:LOW QUALITY PROTEIN: protein NRT1/ PTR FAMILY 3.1-like n=1 Tax=Phalaenopsis equestris TaxID=78828 RepID=UPI0009E46CF2|nr:LOW QUALITY PROTEIN: protein NRT1/ PTR FAMILY 3.1-like [Phalaenopsis equestris]
MAGDGREEEEMKKKNKLGGLKTMPFILANEVCDRFATAGFNANMVQYLQNELHLPLIQATNTLNNFSGTASLTPIIGALIADSFAGRFWTIAVGSLIYQLGMMGVTISALLPVLRPMPCPPQSPSCQKASAWQLAIFYISLLLTAVGSGGIRPCVVAFGADQFELDRPQQRPGGSGQRPHWSFFNLYFFSMGAALLLALTVVVYIQDNVGWGLGFGIPTIVMFVSVIAFVLGSPLYIRRKPGGSPLTRLAQVVVAAVRKRKLVLPEDSNDLYQNKQMDADISMAGRLLHTEHLTFLDRAAILTNSDITTTGIPHPWRLSTVHRIEELKSILRMLPIWSVGILIITASSHNHTFTIIQAKSMDRHLVGNFKIPPATLSIFSILFMLLTLALYDRLLIPLARRLTRRPTGLSYLQRIGVGLAISLISNISAALVETQRRTTATAHGLTDRPSATVPISVFWLVPQFAVHGIAEAFSSVGHMEFLYDQSPESMRSMAAALFWLAASLGNYGGTLLVILVSHFSKRTKEGNWLQNEWLQNDINKGRLNYYYWLVVGLQVFNFVYYLVCARFYKFKPLEVVGDENMGKVGDDENGGGGCDVELAAGAKCKLYYANQKD